MASPVEQAVRDILREAGQPMSTAEIATELEKRVKLTAKDPRSSVRNAIAYKRACVSAGRGSYVYTRTAVNGALVRDRLRLVSIKGGYCAVGAELIGLLWPGFDYGEERRPPKIALEHGPTIEVGLPRTNRWPGSISAPSEIVKLPAPFWTWWEERKREGANELVVHCVDGEAGNYTARAIRREDLDPAAVAAATDAARTAAGEALRGGDRGHPFSIFVLRLLVGGAYHGEVAPDPLSVVLLSPYSRFYLFGPDSIEYRPDLTPEVARLLHDRLLAPWVSAEEMLRADLKLSPLTSPSYDEIVAGLAPDMAAWRTPEPDEAAAAVVQAYRLKVELQNVKGISRTIEVREDQSLEDVHDAIQDAFGWDDDHLFAFYLGSRRYDQLTAIQRGTIWGGEDPPVPDEVTLGALGYGPKRSFSYLFDFGDPWLHELTVQSIAPADGEPYPRLVASEGDAPVQYPSAEEEDEDWDGEDEDAEPDDGDDWVLTWGTDTSAIDGVAGGLLSPFGAMPPGGLDDLLDAFGLESIDFNDLEQFSFPPADPALRRLPINLNELAPAFELVPPAPLYLDAERGDILLVPQFDAAETRLLRETIEASPARYLPVPVATGERQLAAMAAFVDTVADPRLQRRLKTALQSKRPVDRFYRALDRDETEAERWSAAVDRRVIEDALAWLASHGIYPDPPTEPEPPPPLIPEIEPPPRAAPPRSIPTGSKRPKKRRRK